MRRPLALHEAAAEEGPVNLTPHWLSLPQDSPPPSGEAPSLPWCCIWLLCNSVIYKFGILMFPKNFQWPGHLYTWVQDGQIWLLPEMALTSVFPAGTKTESLAFIRRYLRREFCRWCTRWLRGPGGGFGMGFHLTRWANLILPLQPAHFRNQLSQRSLLLLLSH